MKMAPWIGLTVALIAAGCSEKLEPDSGDIGPGTGVVDDTGDDDTSDSGTDPIDDDLVNCRSEYPTADPGGVPGAGECTTDQIFCDEFIQGTTVGGSNHYDTEQYLAATFATGAENWDAPERVYNFRQPIGESVRITFYGPCGDMALGVCAGWECSESNEVQSGDCSSLGTRDAEGGLYRDYPATSSGVREFELIVDGRDGAQGNYGLKVECFGG